MLTPLDIQNKEFKKAFRGYNETDVDSFLDEIILDYEKLYKENIELKDKIAMLTKQLDQYNDLEETLKNTLVVAQSTAEEVTLAAKNRADLIVKEAESNAEMLIKNANIEVIKVQNEYENLKKEILIFITKFRTLLNAQMTTMDDYYKDIETRFESKNDDNDNSLEEGSKAGG
jgi:cell division initiation protein